MKKLIYVSGPFSNGDTVENTRRACEAGNKLLEKGYIPFIPHLALFWHFAFPKSREAWIEIDLKILCRCDGIFMMLGYESSEGSKLEHKLAYEMKKLIIYEQEISNNLR